MPEDLGEAWCSRCPKPAEAILFVTDGRSHYKAAYCGDCAWLLRSRPKPKKVKN